MPTTGDRPEDKLIEQFLTAYDGRTWAGPLSTKEYPERIIDGGVEVITTRLSDGATLAIEHTLIEPFIGEKTDFHNHFKELALQLKADESLQVPGFAIYVDAPVNVLPRGADRQGIINDVAAWIRENRMAFPPEKELRPCPCPHHPDGSVILQVSLQSIGESDAKFLIVQRYGEQRVGDAVEKALRRKLGKLAKAEADRRLLFLERDQAWVLPKAILDDVERLRPQFSELASIHEIWIVDTATFGEPREYVAFSHREHGALVEAFSFYRGKLRSMTQDSVPIPIHD